MTQYSFAFVIAAIGIDVLFQNNLVARQRTRFVGAKNIHRTEVLDGIQVLDNRFLLRHGQSTFRKVGGYNHRKHLGRESHGYRNGEDESLEPIPFRKPVDEEYERNHDQHKTDEQQAYFADSFVESSSGTVSREVVGDSTEESPVAGFKYDTFGCATDNGGTHVADVIQFHDAAFPVLLFLYFRKLLYRFRLSGQGSLTDEQVLGFDDAQVCRNHVSGCQEDDVSRNQFRNIQFFLTTSGTLHETGILYHFH